MTVQPYDDKVEEYFSEIEAVLKNTNHELIAIGNKAMAVDNVDFKAKITVYSSLKIFLNQF